MWVEPLVPWGEPVYPEEVYDEIPSPLDEEESGSEFVSSESTSE